jgi:hypothetical protein
MVVGELSASLVIFSPFEMVTGPDVVGRKATLSVKDWLDARVTGRLMFEVWNGVSVVMLRTVTEPPVARREIF